ncbi:uncharacterized protein At4g38062 [Aristolochia californica]|uniref:uncharacterized protein At4g38062 n=1 Tax=Aristolochia californica TaxID=171875 RepID=UPI0035DDF3EF
MDEICKELDEKRAELERLKENYKVKAELSESLMKSHNEQLIKLQEAKLEIEKQALELNKKNEELYLATQTKEDLKHRLHEKESVLKHLTSTQDQLRTGFSEKVQKLESENKELLSALDEANAKLDDQETKIIKYKVEVEGLKGLVSASEKKRLDAEQRSKAPEELRRRDSLLQEFEEENRKLEDKLKWKNEQFQHLEQAYEKLNQQFEASRSTWESEKSLLLEEISTLLTKLESLSRVLEAVQSQLGLCNQALAHEQSQKKLLEIQLIESKRQCESVAEEYKDTKSALESLTQRRDEEVASLRNSLAATKILLKEMEYKQLHLEQDNQDLKESLKELREAQISRAGSSTSLSKLHQKFRGLEQVHKNCSVVLKAKEAELNTQIETIEKELHASQFQLSLRDRQIKELRTELEGCYSSLEQLKIQNEEISMTLLVLKSELPMSPVKSHSSLMDMEQCLGMAKEQIILLTEQLEQKVNNLVEAEAEIEKGHKLVALLAEKYEFTEQLNLLIQKEFQSCKERLEESYKCQNDLKEKTAQKERAITDNLTKVSDALDKANSDLAERELRENAMESEILRLKTVAEQLEVSKKSVESELKACWEKNEAILEEIEAANLSKIKSEKALVEANNSFSQIQSCKERLEESYKCQNDLKEKAAQKERAITDNLTKVSDALDKANADLAERELRENAMESEILRLKTVAEQLEVSKKSVESELKACWEKKEAILEEIEAANLSKIKSEKALVEAKNSFSQIQSCNERLEESYKCQNDLKEKTAQKERAITDNLTKVSDALDKANSDLAERELRENAMESEILRLKTVAEQLEVSKKSVESELKACWEKNEAILEEIEAANLSKIKSEKALVEAKNSFSQIQSCNERLEESYKCQNDLKEKTAQKERAITDNLTKVSDALDKANSDLAERELRENAMESEILRLKTVAEQLEVSKKSVESELKACWEKNEAILEEMEAANLSKIKSEKALVEAKNSFSQIIDEKHRQLDSLRQEVEFLEQESITRETEAAVFSAGKISQASSQEKQALKQIVEHKDKKINDLQLKLELLQQEFTNSVNAAVNSVAEKQSEIDSLYNTLEKILVANILSEIQVQYLEVLIMELEEENRGQKQKLELKEKLEDELKMKILTKDRAKEQLKDKIRTLESLAEELRTEIKGLFEINMKLSSEKDELLSEAKSFSDKMEEVLGKDAELIGSLKMLALSAGIEEEFEEYMKEDEMFSENNNDQNILPPPRIKEERFIGRRAPLKDLNA